MSKNLLQIWFKYACQQLNGVADACLFVRDGEDDSFTLVESTSESFSQSRHVFDNIDAVVKRRKAVDTFASVEQKSSLANGKTAAVTDINARNYLVAAPLMINKQFVGAVCFEFKNNNRFLWRFLCVRIESEF